MNFTERQRDIRELSKGQIHNIFKTEFGSDIIFIKLSTANHHLPIKTGRWRGIPKLERTCPVCKRVQTADEYHYILERNVFELQQKKYLPKNIIVDQNL